MEALHASLLTLQELDDEIARTEARLEEFGPKLEALEAPIAGFADEVEATRLRLQELRHDVSRLERAAEQNKARLQVYEDRLMRVRNVREEAAARAEMDLVRRALEADVAELQQQSEQATRTDLRLDEMSLHLARLREEVGPQRKQLEAERREVEDALAVLKDRRENHALRLDTPARRLYERVRTGRTHRVLAPLTEEGACGNCFNVLPLQEQADVRRGQALCRCEVCGVILYVD
jgi:predicted  nucleic acid-binding Zn-ribbon protein